MTEFTVTFLPEGKSVQVPGGSSLLQAQITAGLRPDALCGSKGTCGKCRVMLEEQVVLACQTAVDRDMTVYLPQPEDLRILTEGLRVPITPDGTDDYALAFDVGTTTVAAYLLDGRTGDLLAQSCCANPQNRFGADVVSRLQYALKEGIDPLCGCIREAMESLAEAAAHKAGISRERITVSAIAGNTAMHHLLLNIDPKPLVTPPYMPAVSQALERDGARILPNIAGFVGGDTVACLVATRFDRMEELTLLIDLGTNGEMVLGNRHRRMACSTAAGPAFEGANISCGMRGAQGAVDHVTQEKGKISWHTIGEVAPRGLCGSGLLDLVAVLLEQGIIGSSGRIQGKQFKLCDNVILTQKDVREVQLAKAAIRAGIELLTETMSVQVADIRHVYLAGAFGNYLSPGSACRIGMIPPVLLGRIQPVGNAAGEGAKLCALSREEFLYSQELAKGTEFLELASLPQFQNRYLNALNFPEAER